jgi:hypothetical protein
MIQAFRGMLRESVTIRNVGNQFTSGINYTFDQHQG